MALRILAKRIHGIHIYAINNVELHHKCISMEDWDLKKLLDGWIFSVFYFKFSEMVIKLETTFFCWIYYLSVLKKCYSSDIKDSKDVLCFRSWLTEIGMWQLGTQITTVKCVSNWLDMWLEQFLFLKTYTGIQANKKNKKHDEKKKTLQNKHICLVKMLIVIFYIYIFL